MSAVRSPDISSALRQLRYSRDHAAHKKYRGLVLTKPL